MKYWAIWNRSYNKRYFMGETIVQAMDAARAFGHIRQHIVRKWAEVSEEEYCANRPKP